jgi:hypothetical protein
MRRHIQHFETLQVAGLSRQKGACVFAVGLYFE